MIDQKETRLAVDIDLLQCDDQGAHFMKTATTTDESWVHGYNPENKNPVITMEGYVLSKAKKARQVWSKETVMLTVFFNHKGIVYHEYAPDGQTVNKSTTSKFSIGRMMQCGTSDLRCVRCLADATQ